MEVIIDARESKKRFLENFNAALERQNIELTEQEYRLMMEIFQAGFNTCLRLINATNGWY